MIPDTIQKGYTMYLSLAVEYCTYFKKGPLGHTGMGRILPL